MKRILAATATVAVLALSACTPDAVSGTPSPTPLPSSSPLPTATATPTIKPSPANTGLTTKPTVTPPPRKQTAKPTTQAIPEAPSDIPGDLGEVPAGFSLPDEDRPGDEETSAFTTTVWRASCPDRVLKLDAASGITASRVKESLGPEHAVVNGLFVFADEAAAQAFMDELGTKLRACAAEGPDEDGWRTVQATRELADLGDGGLDVGSWSEWDAGDDGYIVAPGAGLEYIVRSGAHVVIAQEGGEYAGDPGLLPDVVADLRARITTMLDQL